jgi:hypothetical protein
MLFDFYYFNVIIFFQEVLVQYCDDRGRAMFLVYSCLNVIV